MMAAREEESATDTEAAIIDIIRRVSRKDVAPTPDELLFESGLLDSFAMLDVVAELEKCFSIEIPEADLRPQKFASVARIRDYVEQR